VGAGKSSGLMKQKISLKDKELRKQINGKFNNIVLLMKINKKMSLEQFLPLSEAEIQDPQPAQANFVYFRA
jgi:hypothetical protein